MKNWIVDLKVDDTQIISKQWLNFHVWNTGTSTQHSQLNTGIEEAKRRLVWESFFFPVPAVRRGTFRMCWGSRHFATTWGDDYGMLMLGRFLCGCWDFSQSQNINFTCGGFCLCPKISVPVLLPFWLGKKNNSSQNLLGIFHAVAIISLGVSRINFRHRSCGAKKKHQKITIKKTL